MKHTIFSWSGTAKSLLAIWDVYCTVCRGLLVTEYGKDLCEKHYNEQQAKIKARLEYLRGEIIAERISYGEIFELQDLAKYMDRGDVLLLEWAGVPEFPEEQSNWMFESPEKTIKRLKDYPND